MLPELCFQHGTAPQPRRERGAFLEVSQVTLSPKEPPAPSRPACLAVIVRHGQTVYNRKNLFRGRYDLPLDDVGIEQARSTAAFLAAAGAVSGPVTAVYSSPLRRARETALPIAELLGLEVAVAGELNDVDVGRWEGRSAPEVETLDAGLYRMWSKEPARFAFPGGESLASVHARTAAFLDRLPARHDGQNVVLVTHRVPAKLIVAHILGLGAEIFWRVRIDNCSISAARLSAEGHVLTLVNSTWHLPAGDEESGSRAAKPDF